MKQSKAMRADAAKRQFKAAAILAAKNGLQLRQCSEIHYQLRSRHPQWLINLYPTKQRVYHDKNLPGPFLTFDTGDFNLLDVVRAAISPNHTSFTERQQREILRDCARDMGVLDYFDATGILPGDK